MNTIDVTFDLETTSLSTNAAIMTIGAIAWNRDANVGSPFVFPAVRKADEQPKLEYFYQSLDLREQFINAMDFDTGTAYWWARQSDAAQRALLSQDPIMASTAIHAFFGWIAKLNATYKAKHVVLWCQGGDFDIPILRNAVERLTPEYMAFPINRNYFRDCRGFIHEAARLLVANTDMLKGLTLDELTDNPTVIYQYLPDLPNAFTNLLEDEVPHTSLFDAIRSAWNTAVMYQALMHCLHKGEGYKLQYTFKDPKNNH